MSKKLSERIGWFVETLTEDGENADVFSVEWLTRLRDDIAMLEKRHAKLLDLLIDADCDCDVDEACTRCKVLNTYEPGLSAVGYFNR